MRQAGRADLTRKYFGTDGIRDVAGQGLLAEDCVRRLGRAIGRVISARTPVARVLIGRDTRASGPQILEQLSEGILAAGHSVQDGEILSTPAVQTLCRTEGFDLAVVISASHNPAHDNGIKLFGADGRKLSDDLETRIEAAIDADGTARGPSGMPGRLETDPTAEDRYLAWLRRSAFPDLDLRGLTLVVDAAHGAAYRAAPRFLAELGARVVSRGTSPTGHNINDGAGVFAVEGLGPIVVAEGAAMGLALDGDADRVLLVDELGAVVDGDHMLGFLARDLHRRGALPGNRLVTTVMANLGLKVFLQEQGIGCEMVAVGDRHVSARMAETGAVLGGEQSGHIIFRSGETWTGDGLFTALRVLEVRKREGRPLSEMAKPIVKYPQVLVNVKVATKPKLESLPELVGEAAKVESSMAGRGRVLLRYSGTEPLLRVMVEGPDARQIRVQADQLAALAERLLSA